ncbi:MAG: sensor histidine kinase [Alphaproteobacteria bacterium]|nr:sensor histidine kinase [Alphaproteobacteria bacterium]
MIPTWFGRLSVRVRLVVLLLLVTIPVIVAAVANAVNRREADLAAGRRLVGLFADAVLREQATVLSATQQLLMALAAQGASADSPAACDPNLAGRIESTGGYLGDLFLLDQSGALRCSSGGEARFSSSALVRSINASGGFSVSLTVMQLPGAGGPALLAGLPVPGAPGGVATVGATMPLAGFASMPGYARMPAGGAVWILSRSGDPVVNIIGGDTLLPKPVSALLAAANTASVLESGSPSGEPGFYAVRALTDSILLMAALPAQPTLEHADADFAFRIAQIILLVGLSVLVVTVGAHYAVLKPLRTLGSAFRSYGGSDIPFAPPRDLPSMPTELRRLARRFVEVTRTVSDREVRLKELLSQRDLLVRELHHRIKNNLQIVSSMLSLQAHRIRHPVARTAIHVARERIAALLLLHQHMYLHHQVRTIEIQSFLNELVAQLVGMSDEEDRNSLAIDILAPPMELSSDQAGPLGLLIAEMVINCLGSDAGGDRTLGIMLRRLGDDRMELSIRKATGPLFADPDGLSLTLIRGYVQQLGGVMEITGQAPDFLLRVAFPVARS